jgi:hypothetical protein
MQSSQDRLRKFRADLADSEYMLAQAEQTRQDTEMLEFVVEKLRALITDAERDLGFSSA